jgi:hypothetical protein
MVEGIRCLELGEEILTMSMFWIVLLALAGAAGEHPAATAPATVERSNADNVLAQIGGRNAQQGPGGMAQGNGAPANDDFGPDLVDLIQKTISKDIWDVNNGPASIFYWRQGRSLIIAAPEEVHEQIQDVLEQLERANR